MDRALERDLVAGGFAIREVRNLAQQAKATYYKPDGTPLPNLPADPRSMRRYLDRGFTLMPPNGRLVCTCGFEAKSKFGLMAHRRKHKKEDKG